MQKYLIIALFIGILAPAQKVWTLEDCLDYAVENNITVKKNGFGQDDCFPELPTAEK
jgi:hypothetical protein